MTWNLGSRRPLRCALPFLLLAAPAAARETPYAKINAAAATSPVTLHPLRGGMVMLEGSGGNMIALSGPEGIFMVDDGIAVSQDKIGAELRRIGPGPLRYVVNTHWHWDHADGNVWTHQAGAILIGSANTAKHLGETIRVVEWGHTFTPKPADGRIAMIVDGDRTIAFGDEQILLRRYIASHTDGDVSAFFRSANVLATGDTFWNGLYPFIDYVAGGSINGMIAAANANIAIVDGGSIVVPGHGPVGDRAALIEYRDMLVAIRDNVAALKRQGKTLEQTIAAHPTAAFDAKWGQAIISPALFTTLVYRGV